jgi:hypothetical protein
MLELPELPFAGDPTDHGEEDVPEADYLTRDEAEDDDTVDVDEEE